MKLFKKADISILTSFLVIILVVIAAFVFIYYESLILLLNSEVSADLNRYELVKDSREKIFYCYGNVIDIGKLNESCDIDLIVGFSVKRLPLEGCSSYSYNSTNITYFKEKFVYAVPVKESNSTDSNACLGKLEVYI